MASRTRHVLGAAVPLRLVLARTPDVVVAITRATAYPTRCELGVAIRRREAVEDTGPGPLHGPWGRRAGAELPPDFVRFGVQFSNGSKATNLLGRWPALKDAPDGPVLWPRGGGGGGCSWDGGFWLWPLPPPGPLVFVCEWPSEGIELTRTEIDAAVVRDAAAQAEILWAPPEDDPGGGYSELQITTG